MQLPEIQVAQEAATWAEKAGILAFAIVTLGGALWGLLKEKPLLMAGGAHRAHVAALETVHKERITALELQVTKAEASAASWQKIALDLMQPLETMATLGAARQQERRR